MATTKADVQYVQIERVQFWADKDTGDIHITTDDPDAKEVLSTRRSPTRRRPSATTRPSTGSSRSS